MSTRWAYRIPLLVGLIFPSTLMLATLYLPETPRKHRCIVWHVRNDLLLTLTPQVGFSRSIGTKMLQGPSGVFEAISIPNLNFRLTSTTSQPTLPLRGNSRIQPHTSTFSRAPTFVAHTSHAVCSSFRSFPESPLLARRFARKNLLWSLADLSVMQIWGLLFRSVGNHKRLPRHGNFYNLSACWHLRHVPLNALHGPKNHLAHWSCLRVVLHVCLRSHRHCRTRKSRCQ